MTDRFKFRVWNKRDELYEDIDDLYSYCIRQDGTFHLTEDGGCDINIYVNDYIVEQCTGLKDKNGKLIYEGDILYIKNIDVDTGLEIESDKTLEYRQIQLEDDARQCCGGVPYSVSKLTLEDIEYIYNGKYIVEVDEFGYYLKDTTYTLYPFGMLQYNIKCEDFEIEIIGNIHENNELLEE